MSYGKYKDNIKIDEIEGIEYIELNGYISSFKAGTVDHVQDGVETYRVPNYLNYDPEKHYVIRVSGDSMSPEICNGDLVVIDLSYTASKCKSGYIVAAYLNGGYLIKVYEPGAYYFMLSSVNPKYDPIRITEEDDCTILGRVIFSMKEH